MPHLSRLKIKAIDQKHFHQVEMESRVKDEVGCSIEDRDIDLEVCVVWVS
jgi:hypothetical protein